MGSVEERLSDLERTVAALAGSKPDEIRARRVTITNDSGAPALELSASDRGGVVTVMNAFGAEVIHLGIGPNGGGTVGVQTATGMVAVSMAAHADGGLVAFGGPNPQAPVMTLVANVAGGMITVNGLANNVAVQIGTTENGGMLTIATEAGVQVVQLLATSNGGAVGLGNNTGQSVAFVGADGSGGGRVQALAGNGKVRTL